MAWWNPVSWVEDITGAGMQAIGSNLASGIAVGAETVFGDLWQTIEGPVEFFLGMSLIIIGLVIAFSNQMFAVARLGMMVAA